ncbi:glycoside hydrolase family 2 [Pedobacter frigiditerrae]|uniref:beta-galactosidase n=1 Tax=Pedobacter frigiditerrae TaxID=2530452 RepID=A0A4R0MKY2_9SPHI|nr:glycoside hydrolase family 2 TIM barrel-domain containing protein [Pedobacter frigiditerrae]TCC87288.1 glycoside hydrolase family 2 [Pedobacter frigiditerrae]
MKKSFLFFLLCITSLIGFSQQTIVKYLSGTDKDNTVLWDFYCSSGRKSGQWSKIKVPSNWEQQGFGTYNYGHDKNKANEQGIYKHEFVLGALERKRVFIVFEGVMTDTKVMINGTQVGDIHQGGFYRFKYDITKFIKPNGKNLLEVTVDKNSTNTSVNSAERTCDFWVFGGIYRPVYLEIVPEVFVDRVAVHAKANGDFQMDIYPQNLKGDETLEAQVKQLNGANVGQPIIVKASATEDKLQLKGSFIKPKLWSAEFPHLYQVVLTIKSKGGMIHQTKQKFGFRTVELRNNDGFYVNGKKTLLKGSNRHSFWPETGRTLSHQVHLLDVKLMKEMNMNAVRMSHYPPDQDFLDVCDSLGLYVIDELTGWQAFYDTTIGRKLVKELVIRDVNHPSVIFWANGNEGGFNRELDGDYDLYDPQKRTVIHPWEKFNGTDTKHYPDYKYMVKAATTGQEVFFPTEFMHGLYDGGAGAALDDFWEQMLQHPHGAGGFIWAFADENVIRTDKNGIYDSDGNHAPDGIVGPHREKEASFFTIKEIWSPIYVQNPTLTTGFNGKISIENRYDFTNINQCTFKWKLVKLPNAQSKSILATTAASGIPVAINLKPGEKGTINLALPANWSKNDALYLTAYSPDKKEVFTWSWPINAHANMLKQLVALAPKATIKAIDVNNAIEVKCDGISYHFDKSTGYIQKAVQPGGNTISLSGGPVLAGVSTALKQFTYKADGKKYIVEADYQGEGNLHVKWTFEPGQKVKLDYQYSQQGLADFMGITFNYPEDKVTGVKYLGQGPYRVWKNRLKGQQFGVWHKNYNNSITGEIGAYPEFKGYYGQVNWVVLENKESPFTVYANNKNMYLQLYQPAREMAALKNNNVEPSFPTGNIGFLNAISPIGTKFQSANVLGPQSEKNKANGELIKETLWFDFSSKK